MPTGGGKSICFQVPALAKEGLCLVISPLIALMKDQVYNLNAKGIKAVAVYTGMSHKQIDTLLDNCIYGNIKFLYVSPERLISETFRIRLSKMKVSLLVVDEAHCISQWGYDFRPPYLKIAEIRENLKNIPVIALTATAKPEVTDDIQKKLLFNSKNVLRKSFVRKNLSYVVRKTFAKEKSVLDILTKVNGSGIVYTRNRRRTKEYSDFLNKNNIKADFYHAGLRPDDRSKKQDDWIKGKTRIICCTSAFGMGIDKPNVRVVIHVDLPESIEAYFQEAGRAGRDEKKAYAVQLLEARDFTDLEKKILEGYPTIDFIKNVYESLCLYLQVAENSGRDEVFDFDISGFSERFHLNPLKALSALKILEQQELIYITEGIKALSKTKFIAGKDELNKILQQNNSFEPLVKFILRTSEGIFEDFTSIYEKVISVRLKITIDEVIRQLNMLDKLNILVYLPQKNKPQLIFLKDRVVKSSLQLDLEFLHRRKLDFEKRLKDMRNYLTENNVCRTCLLVKYFGESISDSCGVCDVCVAQNKCGLSAREFSEIVSHIETELTNSPLKIEQLNSKLKIRKDTLCTAIDYLSDTGKIGKNQKGELQLTR